MGVDGALGKDCQRLLGTNRRRRPRYPGSERCSHAAGGIRSVAAGITCSSAALDGEARRPCLGFGERDGELFFAFGAKAAQLPQAAGLDRAPQILKRPDTKLVVKQLDAFRAQAAWSAPGEKSVKDRLINVS